VEAAGRARGLTDVWSVSQAWLERGVAFWRAVTGVKAEAGREARLGG